MIKPRTSPSKPVLLLAHPRSISTAFERVFMTRDEDVICLHEPFSDAYHWGPEKLSERYEDVEKRRAENGYATFTYQRALQVINDAKILGKRVFVKDMARSLMPLHGETSNIAPSLSSPENKTWKGTAVLGEEREVGNPTVIPRELLSDFHFTFLIRSPRWSIPSLYECSVPPKSFATGWHGFNSADAGYKELRIMFDYLIHIRQIGPGSDNALCLVDAEDLLAHPEETVERFCSLAGLPFDRSSLQWGTEKDQQRAKESFQKYGPFHEVALQTTSLKAQPPKMTTPEADTAKWTELYGKEAAAVIQESIEDNMGDYLYLRQFAIKPNREVRID